MAAKKERSPAQKAATARMLAGLAAKKAGAHGREDGGEVASVQMTHRARPSFGDAWIPAGSGARLHLGERMTARLQKRAPASASSALAPRVQQPTRGVAPARPARQRWSSTRVAQRLSTGTAARSAA